MNRGTRNRATMASVQQKLIKAALTTNDGFILMDSFTAKLNMIGSKISAQMNEQMKSGVAKRTQGISNEIEKE